MLVFASTDFGASGLAALIVLIISVVVFGLIVVAAIRTNTLLQDESPQERRKGACLGSCVVITIIAPCVAVWYFYYKPRWDFEKLLDGADAIQITSLKIEGNDSWFLLDDSVSTDYLTEAFRSNQRDDIVGGYALHIQVSLSTGGSVACWIYIPIQPFKPFPLKRIELGYSTSLLLHDAVIRRSIRLPEPVPEKLAEVINEIRARHPVRPSMNHRL